MGIDLSDVNTFTDPVRAPEDGDPASGDTFQEGLQALANRTRNNRSRLDAHDSTLAAHGSDLTTADARLDAHDGTLSTVDTRLDSAEGSIAAIGEVHGTYVVGNGSGTGPAGSVQPLTQIGGAGLSLASNAAVVSVSGRYLIALSGSWGTALTSNPTPMSIHAQVNGSTVIESHATRFSATPSDTAHLSLVTVQLLSAGDQVRLTSGVDDMYSFSLQSRLVIVRLDV